MIRGYLDLFYGWTRQKIFAIPGRIMALVFVVLLFSAPLLTSEPYLLRIITMATIFSIFAISWDLLSGITGQLSLGHGFFFGVSAYAAALLNIHTGWPPWLTIPAGGIVAVLFGLLIAAPSFRLRGLYLGLVTLAAPVIMSGLVHVFEFTGGEMGIYGVSRISTSDFLTYYVVLITFIVSAFIMYKFADTKSKVLRTGIIFKAIREDEIAARISGILTARYKLLAFVLSSFFAGIAGAVYVHYIRLAGPSMFELFFSFQVILWCMFGSRGTIYGAVVGAFILYPVTEILALYEWTEQLRYLIFACILIAALLFMPQGISIWILDKIEVTCPRCRIVNFFSRSGCRACGASLNSWSKGSRETIKGGSSK